MQTRPLRRVLSLLSEFIRSPIRWAFLWVLDMQRRQLNIKIGTELILPNGKAVVCQKIDGDEYTFKYLMRWQKVTLSRDAIIKMMPQWVKQ